MKILFICKGNWFRSEIAEAVYNKLTHSQDARSAGTYVGAPDEPEGQRIEDLLPDEFFQIMASHGHDVHGKQTRRLTPEMLADADVVVSMAQEPYIPDYLRVDSRVRWWDVADGGDVEETYQKIKKLIEALLLELLPEEHHPLFSRLA